MRTPIEPHLVALPLKCVRPLSRSGSLLKNGSCVCFFFGCLATMRSVTATQYDRKKLYQFIYVIYSHSKCRYDYIINASLKRREIVGGACQQNALTRESSSHLLALFMDLTPSMLESNISSNSQIRFN